MTQYYHEWLQYIQSYYSAAALGYNGLTIVADKRGQMIISLLM